MTLSLNCKFLIRFPPRHHLCFFLHDTCGKHHTTPLHTRTASPAHTMRRNILNAQPARCLAQALRAPHPARRTYASISTKNTPAGEQAHPVGPFYEAILNSAQPIPAKKPEKPPVTAKTSPPSPPIAPAPKPTPPSAKEPAASKAEKATKPAGQAAQPAEPSKAADDAAEPEAPAKRARRTTSTTSTPPPTKPKSVDPPPSSDAAAAAAPVPAPPKPTTAPRDDEAPSNADPPQARVVFGSSLAGPAERAERLAAIRSRSRLVAGVRVPPRPDEPDNCCMSGCVNCVWDRYRDEMEEWAAAHGEAERRLRAQDVGAAAGVTSESMGEAARSGRMDVGVYEMEDGAVSMDEDGGGSLSNVDWDVVPAEKKEGWDEELYKNVPVGIREFMKQEKRLKEKHLREGTLGG